MSHQQSHPQSSAQVHTPSLPVTDYRAAIAGAVEWLGERYLLAKPINAVRNPTPPAWRADPAFRRRYLRWLQASSSLRGS
ncbi:MAG TPA: hypothetical protein VMD56_09660 [Steroidobacteraceae bacterium]|nr:hypothetical protein [Steroidobacteraceae bacterium]